MQRAGGKASLHPVPQVERFRVTPEGMEWLVTGRSIHVVVHRNGTVVARGGRSGELTMPEPPTSGDTWTLHASDQWGRTATATVTIP